MGKTTDPRIKKLERLLSQAMELLGEIRASPAPRARRKRKPSRRYRRAPILAALREGARPTAPAGERDPRLPSYPIFLRLRRNDRRFDAQARKAIGERPREPRALQPARSSQWRPLHERYDLEAIARTIEAGTSIGWRNTDRQGLPDPAVIRAARERYPWFEARVRPVIEARRRTKITFNHDVVLSLVRDGASPRAKTPVPGMPSFHAIRRARRENPGFDASYRDAWSAGRAKRPPEVRAKASPRREPARPRLSTCLRFDREAIAADIEAGASINNKSSSRGCLPSEYHINRLAALFPDFARRIAPYRSARRPQPWGVERQADVLELIREGASVQAKRRVKGMPHPKVVARWKKIPAFAAQLEAAEHERARRRLNRARLRKAPKNAAWTIAQRAVPRTLDSDMRDDVVSELSLMILSGAVGLSDDLGAAWKQCRARLSRDRWKETSLDAPLNGYEGASRIDFLSDDTPHF